MNGDYHRYDIVVTAYLETIPSALQIALGAHGLSIWCWGDTDPTPAPYLDNVAFRVFRDAYADLPASGSGTHIEVSPNPFNPVTTFSFEAEPGRPVRIAIQDFTGRRVRSLWQGHAPSGGTSHHT